MNPTIELRKLRHGAVKSESSSYTVISGFVSGHL